MIFPGYTANQMKEYVMDMENAVKENSHVKDLKMIKKEPDHLIMYYIMSMPLMTERDCVIEVKIIDIPNDQDKGILCWCKTITHEDYPEKKKPIRIDIFKATKCFDKDGSLHILEFQNMDMKGWFPVSLFNMVIGSAMKKGIPDLMKQMDKHDKVAK